jgi:hypothetical protein
MNSRGFLNFALLFILVFSFFWEVLIKYQVDLTPVSIIIFILLFLYLASELRNGRLGSSLRLMFLGLILLFTIGLTLITFIAARHEAGPEFYIHDGALQVEEAVKYLLSGKNPYLENYFGTPLEKWGYGDRKPNPALYHLAYLPFMLLSALPFYLLSLFILGWFDLRFVYLLSFIGTLFLILKIPKKEDNKMLFLILFTFNPLFIFDFIEGLSDIFIFFWLLLSINFLQKSKFTLSSIPLALAFSSKHSAWFIFPFYLFFIYQKIQVEGISQRLIKTARIIWPFFWLCSSLILPFLIWNPQAFIDDTYRYLNGSLPTSYPIRGFGFSTWLWSAGIIKSRFTYFPFWILQGVFGIPTLGFLLKQQRKNNTLNQLVINYAVLLWVFWFFSRFFNPNYLGFLSMLFITGYFLEGRSAKA